MTATAERVLEEIRRLPPDDLHEVCQAVLRLAGHVPPAPVSAEDANAKRPSDEGDEDANEAAFFAALDEARRLWSTPGREVPDLD
jgi:hypothetical protein